MVEVIRKAVPPDTPLKNAWEFMQREGFTCSEMFNESFGDAQAESGIDFLYCWRRDGRSLVKRRAQVAIVHRDGKVTNVLASTNTEGP